MLLFRRLFYGFSFLLMGAAIIYCIYAGYPQIGSFSAAGAIDTTPPPSDSAYFSEHLMDFESAPPPSVPPTESAVQTQTGGEALGKIVKKTVTFSSGKLKYKNVAVNNNAGISVNLETELSKKLSFKIEATESPQVLIVHTHTTECYMNENRDYYTKEDQARTTDDSKNIVAVGNVLAEGLQAQGIKVIHATEKHDYPEYTGSYDRAAVTIKNYLKKYPTIKVVIDLHRDAMMDSSGTKTALVSNIKGQEAAQVMLVAGCQSGGVSGFPNWRENFRLGIKLQQTMETKYPTLARPILFTARKYNQHLTKGSLLIECGTDANTLEQAKYSAVLLADCIAETLKSLN